MEQNEKQTIIPSESTSNPIKSRKSPAILIAGIALVFSILAAVELGFYEHENSNNIATIRSAVTALQEQAQTSTQQLSNTLTYLQQQTTQQQNTIAELQQITSSKQSSWLLSEANYAVRLADYKLRFMRDVPTAIALLQSADASLATLDDPNLLALRQLLAKNIADLQAVPKLDMVGILTRLTVLQQQVAQLPLQVSALPTEKSTANGVVDNTLPMWRRASAQSWHTLQQLIVIRRVDKPIEPLPSVVNQAYLQQNIQLLLQQARVAVLRNQADIYQSSLQQASDWIKRYFSINVALTQSLTQNVSDLQKIDIAPSLPDLTKLEEAVRNAVNKTANNGK